VSPWTTRYDLLGQPHTSVHRDGHRVGLFPEGWWAYHRNYCYRPMQPCIGPEPAGPFSTLRDAQIFIETQGWVSQFPFQQEQIT